MISPQLQEYLKHNSFESLGLDKSFLKLKNMGSYNTEFLLQLEKLDLLDLFLADFAYSVYSWRDEDLGSCFHIFKKYYPNKILALSNYTGEVIYCHKLKIGVKGYVNVAPIVVQYFKSVNFNTSRLRMANLRDKMDNFSALVIKYYVDDDIPFCEELIQVRREKILINKDHPLYKPELELISRADWHTRKYAILQELTGSLLPLATKRAC